VDLHDHVEVQRERLVVQRGELVGLQRGDDEQDRVGAGDRRLVHLVGVDHEVLAQDRQGRRGAGLLEVGERAAEVRALGEDRPRGGAAALVGLGDLGDGRARADLAGRRRAALVLGDDRHARAHERLGERAPLAVRRQPGLQLCERDLLATATDLVAGDVDDAFQDVAHADFAGASSPLMRT
jgi:hypothetical protein